MKCAFILLAVHISGYKSSLGYQDFYAPPNSTAGLL